jgi:hypothetical protein
VTCTHELERVPTTGSEKNFVGRAKLAEANVVSKVVLDDKARVESDNLCELVLTVKRNLGSAFAGRR